MKDSFVFHEDYISDLPSGEEYKFTMYIVRYALYDETPNIQENTYEFTHWTKIKKRIDQDREKWITTSEKRKQAAAARRAKYNNEPVKEEEPKKKSEHPTVEDVKEYCKEKGYKKVDAEKFINYYTANGWKVGKNAMKNWKAAVANWDKNNFGSSKKQGTIWGNENEVPDEIMNML